MVAARLLTTVLAGIVFFSNACTLPREREQGVKAEAIATDTVSRIVIAFYDSEEGKLNLIKAARLYCSEIVYHYKNLHGMALSVPRGKSEEEALAYYRKVKGVLGVSRNEKAYLHGNIDDKNNK
ncbi:hypothetical protein [Porphyromonas loveana]|nr:hypothetical protein [Porphyromonas loveana]